MADNPTPCDPDANDQALQLLMRLHGQVGNGVLFGHQDTSAYGVGWTGDTKNSDIADAVGRWPGVYGWDLGGVDMENDANIDGVKFADISRYIYEADKRGGVVTVSCHQHNPGTGGNAFDNTPCVPSILPGGGAHDAFVDGPLRRIADFLDSLRRDDGTHIPVVLRPFHERNQAWPWWGKDACSPEDYVALWKMTVDYFRDTRGLHHLLYCFAPQDVVDADEYLVGYPGDDYIDVLGLDFYTVWEDAHIEKLTEALRMVNTLAQEREKVAALTETGVQNCPIHNWFTKYLLTAVTADDTTRRTVWALLWRNESEEHFFAPYEGHPSLENFKEMLDSEEIVMGVFVQSEEQEAEQPETFFLENSPFLIR